MEESNLENSKKEGNISGKKEKIVMVGGGFDPLHFGHLLKLKSAKALGDKLIVALDGDGYLVKKKGKPFMPAEDRYMLMKELRCVDEVIMIGEGSIADAILQIKPDIYAHGGDKDSLDTLVPEEVEACKKVGCDIVFNVGGAKIRSSSDLLKDWVDWINSQNKKQED